jgi:Fe-S oxidoreductase
MYVAYYRIQILALGQPENRLDKHTTRIWLAIKYGFLQYKMPRELSAGLLHIMVFSGFMVLSVRTVTLFGQALGGSGFDLHSLPLIGHVVGTAYHYLKELVVIGVLVGVIGFMWRRMVSKPLRMQNIPILEPVMILCWIAGLMLADIMTEAGLHAAGNQVAAISLGGALDSVLEFSPQVGAVLWEAGVWVHSMMVLLFLIYLPFGKHFHIITAIPNVFFTRIEPFGHLRPIENLEEKVEKMEEDPSITIGYKNVENYTWKEILDLYTCTECGRCLPQCPAWATEKPLSLKRVNSESKHHLYERAPFLLGSKLGPDGKKLEYDGPQTAGGAISVETIWACTLCRDCEERCPVNIEQVPRIVDLRRHLVMIEGNMPEELNNTFRGWERNSNPWGLGYDKRGEWIDETVPVKTLAENAEVEYLFYVGCMGSFDDRSTRVTKAVCKILDKAGVSFGVLGMEEQCCGETARRLGNEFLGQMMVQANIEVLQGYKVKKVIAFCPHCFNTLKNEYKDFGMEFEEVWHAADFVHHLIEQGKLELAGKGLGDIAYHDSCFLGRYNEIYEQPRDLLKLCGGTVKEPSLHGRESFCCGAGGGRMWMEEDKPRVNDRRFGEIMDTTGEPPLIGVSCPYCLTMITDGSKNANKEEQVQVKDVLELIADRLA